MDEAYVIALLVTVLAAGLTMLVYREFDLGHRPYEGIDTHRRLRIWPALDSLLDLAKSSNSRRVSSEAT